MINNKKNMCAEKKIPTKEAKMSRWLKIEFEILFFQLTKIIFKILKF